MSSEDFEPLLFGCCGPVASGKSTICAQLCQYESETLISSVSTTTRDPRDLEKEGEHYFFVSEQEFLTRVSNADFIEHAQFGGQRYGTERRNIELAREKGRDLILDVDVQGVEQLKKLYPERLVTIFVFPPSFAELERRLRERGTEDESAREERLWIAKHEVTTLKGEGFSDYLLINDDLERSVSLARSIVKAERARYGRYPKEVLDKIFAEMT